MGSQNFKQNIMCNLCGTFWDWKGLWGEKKHNFITLYILPFIWSVSSFNTTHRDVTLWFLNCSLEFGIFCPILFFLKPAVTLFVRVCDGPDWEARGRCTSTYTSHLHPLDWSILWYPCPQASQDFNVSLRKSISARHWKKKRDFFSSCISRVRIISRNVVNKVEILGE